MSVFRGSRLSVFLVLVLGTTAAPAVAQDVPFLFLVEDGWTLFQHPHSRPEINLFSWGTRSTFYTVVNGQKGALAGNAFVHAWQHTVSVPAFASLGSVAGLLTLDFGGFRGHLTVFDTPSGIQTTIGVMADNGDVNPAVSGVWVYGNGTSVVGGTVDDMVVGGIVHFGQPQSQGPYKLTMSKYFGPAPSDLSPFSATGFTPAMLTGAFLGQAPGPLRTLSRVDQEWTGYFYSSDVLVLNTGTGYAVVACSTLGDHPGDHSLDHCTVSGTGGLGRLTGKVTGYLITGSAVAFDLNLSLYIAP